MKMKMKFVFLLLLALSAIDCAQKKSSAKDKHKEPKKSLFGKTDKKKIDKKNIIEEQPKIVQELPPVKSILRVRENKEVAEQLKFKMQNSNIIGFPRALFQRINFGYDW